MGILLALVGAFLNSAKDLFSKRLAALIDGDTSTFTSFAYAIPLYCILLLAAYLAGFETFAITGNFFLFILLRAVCDCGTEWTRMHAFAKGDISLVAPYMSLAPLFLLVLSPLITGDVPSAVGVFAVLLSFAGGLLNVVGRSRVHLDADQRKAILLALCTSFCFALNICFDRLAVQTASPLFSGFMMTLLCAIFFLPLMWGRAERWGSLPGAARPLTYRAVLEVLFMITKLSALQYLQAPYVSALGRVALILSIVGGRVVFKEEDFVKRLISGLLIAAGAVSVAFA